MFNFLKRHTSGVGLLSEAEAKAIIEAELNRRGWKFPPSHGYSLVRLNNKMVWRGVGHAFYTPGGGRLTVIAIDAKTGEIITASNGLRDA